ncbi:SDR family oxidoreductase [Rhizobium sp. RU36D]|uniref:SDR family NAD(P)-dependent oxidoreductase n=1 Tax=Rhizobium sp. RU36D TaxID=1907415 RepID=UPI0009D7B587|nr:SDR family oxidoreductase [Rhizobium sp. RU36D]SMC97792.1 NAD(P)-dependent dehydrogenase, short-chain alcohol dehydrogenase family [Rhizobium sp. RU36D]
MTFSLTGKTVLLTGASKGIGAETAKTLLDMGAHVVAHYGSDRAGAEAAIAGAAPGQAIALQADLGQQGDARRLWQEAVAWRGRIDVLVNNAAIFLNAGGIEEPQGEWDEVWDKTLAVNVRAPSDLMREAVHHYKEKGGGIIVTVVSWNAQRGSSSPKTIAYAASKGALKAATQTIARNYANQNILAYIIAPGVVKTRMSEDAAAVLGGVEKLTAGLAMGEWVPPEEIGSLIGFLSTGTCRHLTGATLDFNGASYVR